MEGITHQCINLLIYISVDIIVYMCENRFLIDVLIDPFVPSMPYNDISIQLYLFHVFIREFHCCNPLQGSDHTHAMRYCMGYKSTNRLFVILLLKALCHYLMTPLPL